MKRVKICSLVTVALMTASMTMQYTGPIVYAKENSNLQIQSMKSTESMVLVEAYNRATQSDSNTISPNFKITNKSGKPINLSELKLGYYYTSDGNQKENFFCDHAATTTGTYRALTDNIVGNIVDYDAAKDGADKKLEVGFNSGAGTIENGQTVEINVRISKQDWSNFKQAGDYSFDGSSSNYVSTQKVTAELNNKLIYGQYPGKTDEVTNTLNPESTSFDVGQAKDVQVGYTSTGDATLSAIKDGDKPLTKDKDYTVSDGSITLTKSYLNTLEVGKKDLTFDFNKGTDPNFTVIVTDGPTEKINLAIGKVKGNPGEKVKIPVNVSNVPSAGLESYEFAFQYDPSVLENVTVVKGESTPNADSFEATVDKNTGKVKVSYLPFEDEDKVMTNGTIAYIEGTIKSDAPSGESVIKDLNEGDFLGWSDKAQNVVVFETERENGSVNVGVVDQIKLEIGKVDGNQGEKVRIPVNVSNLPSAGLESYEFAFEYDPSVLENVTVVKGESTPNADSFEATVDKNTGKVKVSYLPFEDEDKVMQNGTIAYIEGTIKSDAPGGESVIKDLNEGDFLGWSDKEQAVVVYPTEREDGSVTVPVGKLIKLEIGKVDGNQGEKVRIPVNVSNLPSAGLESYEFAFEYDPSVLENVTVVKGESTPNADSFEATVDKNTGKVKVSYLPFEDEDKVMTNGTIAYIEGTIKSDAPAGKSEIKDLNEGDFLGWSDKEQAVVVYPTERENGSVNVAVGKLIKLEIGKVDGNQGEKVRIPVNVSNLPSAGLESYEFAFEYDPSVLENVTVVKGESTPNADSFEAKVDAKTGKVTVSYLPFEDEDKVMQNGTIAYIEGTIKSNAPAGKSEIKDLNEGDFLGWSDEKQAVVVYPTERENGSVNVAVGDLIKLEIGKVDGKQGEKVRIPVNVGKLPSSGLESYEFAFKYDPSVLENVTVVKGESTPNADSFEATVNAKTGDVTVSYLPFEDEDKVMENGTIAYIEGTIKSDAPSGESEIKDLEKGDFLGWSDKEQAVIVYPTERVSGSVTVGVVDQLKLEIGKVEGQQGEKVRIPVNVSNLPSSGLESYEFAFEYDPSVLENVTVVKGESTANADSFEATVDAKTGKVKVSYLPFEDEDKVMTNGTIAYIEGTIKSDAPGGKSVIKDLNEGDFLGWSDEKQAVVVYPTEREDGSISIAVLEQLKLEIGKVEGNQGEKVRIPVSVLGLPSSGLESYEFAFKYDASVLENVTLVNGESTPNADSFEATVDAKTGEVTVSYLPINDEDKVMTNGVIAYIEGTVKSDAKKGTYEIKDLGKGDFLGWSDEKQAVVVYKVGKINGSITLEKDPFIKPEIVNTIDKDSATFEEGKAEEIKVGYTSTGSKLSGIKNGNADLKENDDYTMSNGTVTFTKNYLNGLKEGVTDLTFDFAEGDDLAFKITVTKPVIIEDKVVVTTPAITAKEGETIKIPVKYSGLPSDGLVATTLMLNYDPDIFESIKVTAGDMLLKSSDNMSSVNKKKNLINITVAALDGGFMKKPGTLVYINLKVKDGVAPCTTKLTRTGKTIVADSNSKQCDFSIDLGDITIQ